MLALAARIGRVKQDNRTFYIGAVAIRSDDVMVAAYNGRAKDPTPEAHCEARLCRKLDRGATVYVARTVHTGEWGMSRPCEDCQRALRRVRVKRVYYTIGPNEFGCLDL